MSKELKQSAIALLAAMMLFFMVVLFPPLSILLMLIPAIFIWLGFNLPVRYSYISGSLFFVFTTFVLYHPLGMMVGLFNGLIAVAMSIVAQRDLLEDAVAKTIVMVYAGILATHYYLEQFYQLSLFDLYQANIRTVLEQLRAAGNDVTGLFNSLTDSYLSVLFMLATGFGLALFILAALLKRYQWIQWETQPFSNFRFKALSLFQFLLIMVAIYGLSAMDPPYSLVGDNGWRIMMTLFSIQGASVVYYFLKKRNLSSLMSWIVIAVSVVMPLVNYLISLLGFSDSLFDFRKLEALK